MEKYIRDGKVAVLYSPGFGAGWSTWNTEIPELVFDKEIVEAILNEDRSLAAEIATKKYGGPGKYVCVLGAEDLRVEWIDKGTAFEIEEYDGAESIHVIGGRDYLVA